MDWTQYLLSKMAEEAVEVAKEALKSQQQGIDSTFRGCTAAHAIRGELIDLYGVIAMLDSHGPVLAALDGKRWLQIPDSDQVDVDFDEGLRRKAIKVCYYAMFAFESKELRLTEPQFHYIQHAANVWVNEGGEAPKPIAHIQYSQ